MKTIIIEDEEQAVSALLADLKKHCPELEVVGTTGGVEEGIELIRHSNPQLVFLDLNMPVMNGWDFIEKFSLDTNSAFKNTKVIILSSTIDPADFNRAKQYNVVSHFLSKPITQAMLEYLKKKIPTSWSLIAIYRSLHLSWEFDQSLDQIPPIGNHLGTYLFLEIIETTGS